MRNLIAVIAGILTSILLMSLTAFLMMRFDIKPFSDFAKGTIAKDQVFLVANKIVSLFYWIFIPVYAFCAGLVSTLFARNREYIIGLICILPLFIIFFEFSFVYAVIVFAAYALMSLGVLLALHLKKKSHLN